MTARFLRLLALLALAWALPAGAASQELREALFRLDDAPAPPPGTAAWTPVALPDNWRMQRPEAVGEYGWYRLRYTQASTVDGLQAVFLPKVIMNAAVYVNGRLIGDGGRMDEPVARNWNRPQFFIVPHGLLHPGDNVIDIRLRGHAYTQAALHPLYIGDEPELRNQFERAHFLNITLNQTATLLIAAIGLLMLTLWWRRKQDTAYAYFAASALIWAVQSTNLYLRETPLSTAGWEILSNGGFQVFAGFLLISLLRFVSIAARPLVVASWAAVILSPLSLLLVTPARFLGLTSLWHLYTLICTILTLGALFVAAFRRGNREARYLVSSMCLVIVFATHDWVIHSQHIWELAELRHAWPLNDVFLLHYSAPLIYLAIGLIMTGRFVRVLNEFESLNDQLETRVAEKQAELRDSFSHMRTLENARVVAEERERIYRDLHDDVGAKLLSLVYRSATPEDAELARSALQDLRDVVSRTGADHYALDAAVADWRAECEKRLGESGLTLAWHQGPLVERLALSQPQALNLGRVLREAVSNVIRHAGARCVEVEVDCADGVFRLCVRDDGKGLAASSAGAGNVAGRGLRNMESRAERLGGRLRYGNVEDGGFQVSLEVPLDAPA